jgi:hypothetical protein
MSGGRGMGSCLGKVRAGSWSQSTVNLRCNIKFPSPELSLI